MMMRAALLHTDIAMAPADQLPAAASGRLTHCRSATASRPSNTAIHYSIAREAVALRCSCRRRSCAAWGVRRRARRADATAALLPPAARHGPCDVPVDAHGL
jgi:hypothetical protein